jgi:AcrR family transcriptional regulator
MTRNTRRTQRGEASLSRERIIEASIALLDEGGATALTFRALSERLATGAGAIYWHVASKDDLLNAACDDVVARGLADIARAAAPQDAIRAIALAMFDAIDAHPWVGTELGRASWKLPMVRVMEGIGFHTSRLGVNDAALWQATSALLNYILGVAGQNAANRQLAQALKLERAGFLDEVATMWSGLDAADYPFTRAIGAQLRAHDDRADYLAGLDLILRGIASEA